MHKNILWLIFAILCIYFSLVLCNDSRIEQELRSKDSSDLLQSDITALQGKEEARLRRKHRFHLHSLWGFYGLAIAYLIKVKVVVVAFFVGSAVFLGLRYFWPHKCASENYKEGSIVLDHPPPFAHHDHVPYSLDHDHYHSDHYDGSSFASSGPSPSFEPYSAYSSGTISETGNAYPSSSFTSPDGPPEILSSKAGVFRRKRSSSSEPKDFKQETGLMENLARQMVVHEEQIGEFMLNFLGLDTPPCRRRFVCEMEFKSRAHPLTAMAFRMVGRTFFAKYTNNRNPLGKANSFEECAGVNAECVFIENMAETEEAATDEAPSEASEEQMPSNQFNKEPVTTDSSLENNDVTEQANDNNLRAELSSNWRRRWRGDRHLKLT